MTQAEVLTRIAIDPNICFGKPCIRGHRIGVCLILDLLANDPGLVEPDIRACPAFAQDHARRLPRNKEAVAQMPCRAAPPANRGDS